MSMQRVTPGGEPVRAAARSSAAAQAARAVGLPPERLPRHVGIIMDGNGRWARSRGFERIRGHEKGASAVRAITTESVRLGIARLTVYAFSSENWGRPAREVDFLMRLLVDFLRGELPTLLDHGVKLEAIGRLDRLPAAVRRELDAVRAATADLDAGVLCLALSYGGRDELVDACRALAAEAAAGRLAASAIDAAAMQAQLYAPHAPDLDLVIRTAGEQRLSNFLPWQAVYAEYVAHPTLWPDFGIADYHACLRTYADRERRFGGVG